MFNIYIIVIYEYIYRNNIFYNLIMTSNLETIADHIVDNFLDNIGLHKFNPPLNKGLRHNKGMGPNASLMNKNIREINALNDIRIHTDYQKIGNHNMETILKKAIQYHFTQKQKKSDDAEFKTFREASESIKSKIYVLEKKYLLNEDDININKELDNYKKLLEQYTDKINELKSIDDSSNDVNYNTIAKRALKILGNRESHQSRELYDLIKSKYHIKRGLSLIKPSVNQSVDNSEHSNWKRYNNESSRTNTFNNDSRRTNNWNNSNNNEFRQRNNFQNNESSKQHETKKISYGERSKIGFKSSSLVSVNKFDLLDELSDDETKPTIIMQQHIIQKEYQQPEICSIWKNISTKVYESNSSNVEFTQSISIQMTTCIDTNDNLFNWSDDGESSDDEFVKQSNDEPIEENNKQDVIDEWMDSSW